MLNKELLFVNNTTSENIYTSLLQNSHGCVIIRDLEDKIVFMNDNAKNVLKEKNVNVNVTAKECYLCFGEEKILQFMKELDQKVLATGKAIIATPFITVKDSPICESAKVLYRVDKIPYKDSKGVVNGVITFMLDTTHSLENHIKKYINDVSFHEMRAQLGNIIDQIETSIK